jgi:B12-binding domain/radical SAM domain protein
MEVIEGRASPEDVPNLSYRSGGRVRSNPLTHVPDTIDCFNLDYEYIFRSFVRSKSLDMLPFLDFIEHPIMAVLTRKGCECNCTACGGSSYAYARICNRHGVAHRSPEKVVEDILAVQEFQVPAFILGDLAIGGEKYGRRILELLRKEKVDIPLIFEAFVPFSSGFMREISRSVDDFTIEMSPDSGVEAVRRQIGRNYSNSALRTMLERAFACGCRQFDLYFSIGLGGQTEESIHATLRLTEQLMREHRGRRLLPFISPYAPFLDPGSIAYEHPERCGFVKFANSMMEPGSRKGE